jgi:RNA polymerase sigma-70 factor (ECF subfamily)
MEQPDLQFDMTLRVEISDVLIAQLREGDQMAFRAIYDQLHGHLYRMVFSLLRDRENTEEVVQETFINLWINRTKLNQQQSLYPYVYLIAKRMAIDHFRKKITETDTRAYLRLKLEEEINDTEETVFASDLQRFTDAAIKTLPQQQQTVFILSRIEGLSYDEIGERMQISRNTVKNHLVCAVKTLKLHFVKHNIVYLFICLLKVL